MGLGLACRCGGSSPPTHGLWLATLASDNHALKCNRSSSL